MLMMMMMMKCDVNGDGDGDGFNPFHAKYYFCLYYLCAKGFLVFGELWLYKSSTEHGICCGNEDSCGNENRKSQKNIFSVEKQSTNIYSFFYEY